MPVDCFNVVSPYLVGMRAAILCSAATSIDPALCYIENPHLIGMDGVLACTENGKKWAHLYEGSRNTPNSDSDIFIFW